MDEEAKNQIDALLKQQDKAATPTRINVTLPVRLYERMQRAINRLNDGRTHDMFHYSNISFIQEAIAKRCTDIIGIDRIRDPYETYEPAKQGQGRLPGAQEETKQAAAPETKGQQA